MQKLYSSLFFLSLSISIQSQETRWQRDIHSEVQDFLSGLSTTVDRQFLVSGSSIRPVGAKGNPASTAEASASPNNGYDYRLVKLDQQGRPVWEKYFSGGQHDFLTTTTASQEGGFLLAGTSFSSEGLDKKGLSNGGSDIWAIKVDEDGNEQWQASLGYEADEEAQSAVQSVDMGYFIAGSVQNAKYGFGSKDAWVIKLDKSGKVLGEVYLGGTGLDEVEKIIPTKDGGCLVAIYSRSGDASTFRVHTEKQGAGEEGREQKSKIPKNYIAKQGENYGEGDYWIVKLDKEGRLEWQKNFGGKSDDHVRVLANTENGYIVGGESRSSNSGNKRTDIEEGTDLWVLELDQGGGEVWQKGYSFGNRDVLMSLNPIWRRDGRNNGFLLGGYTQAEGKAQREDGTFWMLYLDNTGNEVWRKLVEGKSKQREERLVSAILVSDGTYVLAGTSAEELGKESWKIVMLGDRQLQDLVDKRDFSVYPNPAQDYCYVEIGAKFSEAEISIYDMAGKLLRQFKTRNAVNKINTSSLPQGIYMVNAVTEDQKFNAKIVKK